jgi:DNA polymerase elongation subunit (family B)
MKILFVDIETASTYPNFFDMPEDGQAAFKKKMKNKLGVHPAPYFTIDQAFAEAPLFAEFAKIICVGIGSMVIDPKHPDDDGKTDATSIHCKGFVGEEIDILRSFSAAIDKANPDLLCSHNGKYFDYPFLARRYMVNRLPIPPLLNTEGQKPWEVRLLDTADIWRFGDSKYYASLISLAFAFGVQSPKGDMDGSQVGAAFREGRIEDIKQYCLRDVVALINVYRSMRNLNIIQNVVIHE